MTPERVLQFWLDEVGKQGWYSVDETLDQKITQEFYDSWIELMNGGMGMWLTYPTGALAYLIVADQFPRNMFRGKGQAFASDKLALGATKQVISRKFDLRIDEPARQFFYMPLMHSESQSDQDRCIRLILERMPKTGQHSLFHARAHREVIRKFGRFPYRNDALGRRYTDLEQNFVNSGGYDTTLTQIANAS